MIAAAEATLSQVVVLHGVPQTSHASRPIVPALATRYRVVARALLDFFAETPFAQS